MIFTNANDTKKTEESMLSYYNYTSNNKFIGYESSQLNKNDNNNKSIDNKSINYNPIKNKIYKIFN